MSDFSTRFNDVLAPVIAYSTDVEIVSGDGVWVTDAAGKRYLDFACGISVTNVGHQHPGVKAAVLEQIDRLWHAGGSFKYESKIRAAEALREVTPDGIDQFLFMNSGAEAVEAAVKMARKTTGRQGVIVFRGGFHGRTMGAVSYTTSKAKYRQGYHPILPSVFVTPFPHPYRWGMTQDGADQMALAELERLFHHEIEPEEVAAFLVEPVQGEGGVIIPDDDYLKRVREWCDQQNILLILDEVQTGMGRLGSLFGYEEYGIEPDVITLAKGLGYGVPIGAFLSKEYCMALVPGDHGSTFGGNALTTAAAYAGTKFLIDNNIAGHVKEMERHLSGKLNELKSRVAIISEIRIKGLLAAVEFDSDVSGQVLTQANEAGILLNGVKPNAVRLMPPLNITADEIGEGVDRLEQALGKI